MSEPTIRLRDISTCFEGAIPAVIATSAADGTPNVTYLSRVRYVDDDHIALSNQFFSKTARNLAENPRASLLLLDPVSYDQYRLTVVYERTERRGPVFDRLRQDIEALAALERMQDVFKLRSADIYRVVDITVVDGVYVIPGETSTTPPTSGIAGPRRDDPGVLPLAQLSARLSRCPDLDTLVGCAVDGLAEFFGYEHSLLLLPDESGQRLYTIASHGYESQGVGSEVLVGEGPIGMAAARNVPIRIGNLRQMAKYSRSVRRSYEDSGAVGPGREVPLPGLADLESCIAMPAVAAGQLVAVLMLESNQPVAFDENDEARLTIVASLIANAIEVENAREQEAEVSIDRGAASAAGAAAPDADDATLVRYFPVDGSVFLDGDYLIKGVAGRLLWVLLEHHEDSGRIDFTQRELRLDPRLELPELRDNLDSRLILLKRRLDERAAPVRIEKTGRGRFRLHVDGALRRESAGA